MANAKFISGQETLDVGGKELPADEHQIARRPLSTGHKPPFAKPRKVEADKPRGFSIVPYDTFVQPGVDQVYTLVTAVPASTTYVLI